MKLAAIPKAALGCVIVLAGMAFVAGASLVGVVEGSDFLLYAATGSIVPAVIALGARRGGLGVSESAVLSLILYVVVGIVATRGFPTPDNAVDFGRGLTTSWNSLLSTIPPVESSPNTNAMALTVAWIGSAIGAELLLRWSVPVAAAAGPLAATAASLAITNAHTVRSVVVGVALLCGVLCLLGLSGFSMTSADSANRAVRFGPAAVVAVGAMGLATAGAFVLSFDESDRFDLRQVRQSAWDPLEQPSPLAELKGWLKDDRRNDVVFTVIEGQPVDRWPMATLSHYDGRIWTFEDPEAGEKTLFWPVGSHLPQTSDAPTASRSNTVEHQIEINTLGGRWVPTAGTPVRISGSVDVRFDATSGTLASPTALTSGSTYRVTSTLQASLTQAEISGVTPGPSDGASLRLPSRFANVAAGMAMGAPAGGAQLEAAIATLLESGFYDTDPLSSSGRPGHSFNRLTAFLEDDAGINGFEEQYAAAAAVLAEASGFDARVVVGFVVPPAVAATMPIVVRGQHISAWVEVRTMDGWRAIDVTPPRTREPSDEAADGQVEDDPDSSERATQASNTPPERDDETDRPAASSEGADDERDKPVAKPPATRLPRLVYATVGAAVAALGGLGWIAGVRALWRRRTGRRSGIASAHGRIHGAWLELKDQLHRAGQRWPGAHSTREVAARLIADGNVPASVSSNVVALAEVVERAALHPQPPSDHDADAAWADLNVVVAALADRDGRSLRRLVVPPALQAAATPVIDLRESAATGELIDLRLDMKHEDRELLVMGGRHE